MYSGSEADSCNPDTGAIHGRHAAAASAAAPDTDVVQTLLRTQPELAAALFQAAQLHRSGHAVVNEARHRAPLHPLALSPFAPCAYAHAPTPNVTA